MHSPSGLLLESVRAGNAAGGDSAEARMRSPLEPVSTLTWSTVWHCVVAGTHSVTLTYAVLITPAAAAGPASTVTVATLAAAPAIGGELEEPIEVLPAPPPPQAPSNPESANVGIAAAARTRDALIRSTTS